MHISLGMRLLLLNGFFIALPSLAVEPSVPLKTQGQIVSKEDHQTIGDNCKADRLWIEANGLENQAAQQKINTSIRRKLTVGKRLAPKDCPYPGTGGVGYYNWATLSGIREMAIGVETSIHFGNIYMGSGNNIHGCDVYDLATGNHYDLMKYITPEGKKSIAADLCTTAKDEEYFNADALCEDSAQLIQNTIACLKGKGVELHYSTGPGYHSDMIITIPEDKLSSSFTLPEGLDLQ